MRKFFSNTKAFTLAEVLVTLAIIGVLAAMVVPSLMNDINDDKFKTAYKKAFAEAQQAMIEVRQENSFSSRTSSSDNINYEVFLAFKSKFQLSRECLDEVVNGVDKCWDRSGETSNGAPDDRSAAFITNSGMAWSMRCRTSSACTKYGLLLDTNGFKGPNKYGRDRWFFWILNENGVAWSGVPLYLVPSASFDYSDYTTYNGTYCPSPPCYYKSWLLGE